MEWIFIIVCWVILGVVCSSINKTKGRSSGGGFCLGFFLGLIGLLIVVFRPSLSDTIKPIQKS